jgi:predicted DNA-binding transcriptional regulator AlpA
MPKQYLTEKQVSEITGYSVQTLRNHRHESRGIPYLKIGRSVRYLPEDISATMEKVRIEPEAA